VRERGFIFTVIFGLGSLAIAGATRGADPSGAATSSLAALAPPEAGLVVETTRLATRLERFLGSPLAERVARLPAVEEWRRREGPELARLHEQVAGALGVSSEQLKSDLWDGRWLLAIYPPREVDAGGTGRDPAALVVVEARDAVTLQRSAERLAAAWRNEGRLAGQARMRLGSATVTIYTIRADGSTALLHAAVIERWGVLGNDRGLVEASLRLAAGEEGASLAKSAEFAAAVAEAPTSAVARFVVQARPWEALLERQPRPEDPRERREQEAAMAIWRASDHLTLWLDETGTTLRAGGGWRFDPERMPAVVREALACLSGPASFASDAPAEALAVVAARADAARFAALSVAIDRFARGMNDESSGDGSTSVAEDEQAAIVALAERLLIEPGEAPSEAVAALHVLRLAGSDWGAMVVAPRPSLGPASLFAFGPAPWAMQGANRILEDALDGGPLECVLFVEGRGDTAETREARSERLFGVLHTLLEWTVMVDGGARQAMRRSGASKGAEPWSQWTVTPERGGPITAGIGAAAGRTFLATSPAAASAAMRPATRLIESEAFARLGLDAGDERPSALVFVDFRRTRRWLEAKSEDWLEIAGAKEAAERRKQREGWERLTTVLGLADQGAVALWVGESSIRLQLSLDAVDR
jgi:hypothetical protein